MFRRTATKRDDTYTVRLMTKAANAAPAASPVRRPPTMLVLAVLTAAALVGGTAGFGADASTDGQPIRHPLWRANHETGNLSQWWSAGGGGEFDSGDADTVVSAKRPHTGRYSAQMTLTTNSSGTRLFRWREPERRPAAYFSAWYYVPRRYIVDQWWNIFQFKSESEDKSRTDPFWVVNVGNRARGGMFLYLRDERAGRTYGQRLKNFPARRWVHLEAFLRQSANATGRLVLWQNGVKLFDLQGITTTFPGGAQHWSVNNYGDGIRPTPATIFVDDAAISTARVGP